MSQDIVADTLGMMLNAVKAGKNIVETRRYSKLLLSVLAIAKLKGYVKSYEIKDKVLRVEIERLNKCKAIKPRFMVQVNEIEKYVSRYLPARDIGVIIISTSKGLMTHTTAIEKNLGGSLIAYIY
jgi:small subunit ribosomal protein S8